MIIALSEEIRFADRWQDSSVVMPDTDIFRYFKTSPDIIRFAVMV